METYDYIIAGTGAAGLSLAFYLAQSPLKDKKVLLIDKHIKNQNDRTWCFWQNGISDFEDIIYKSWENISFYSSNFTEKINIKPYHYKMIRGIDFYNFVQDFIRKNTSFKWLQADIQHFDSTQKFPILHTNDQKFQTEYIFDGTWNFSENFQKKQDYHYLYQHFKGWFIESKQLIFDAETMHYMDFRVPQKAGEVRFGYVLPFSPNKGLVEFTIFSDNILSKGQYIQELQHYLENILQISDYSIYDEEFGIIPMFDEPFPQSKHPNIISIGTKAGCAKASTGFTFDRIQRHSKQIVENLIKGKKDIQPTFAKKYSLYDSALLNVIHKNRLSSEEVFGRMFQKHPVHRIFRFLDEESSILEDIQIMNSMPWMPFIKAIGQNILRK
ncbi:MAG: lycopene cyclase family protein [Raineya sp.]|jgi:lycopene beta-cyclase|nr:lycopene cyclase family protein [Raineya sp.]